MEPIVLNCTRSFTSIFFSSKKFTFSIHMHNLATYSYVIYFKKDQSCTTFDNNTSTQTLSTGSKKTISTYGSFDRRCERPI